MLSFTINDLNINYDSKREKYYERKDEEKTSLHVGQLKLLLSEIEFFSIYWDPKAIPNPVCVYAGAAPGTHIPILVEMFPTFIFHLYDPAKIMINSDPRIQIFEEYFTDDIAQKYSGRNDVFFISDVRTADYKVIQNKNG